MSLKTFFVAAALAATLPAAGAQAQGYPGYGEPPPPPYAYGAARPVASTCDDTGFTLLGAHAGVTVLGFKLNAGADFDAPVGCSRYDYEAAPQFTPRPYAPPLPPQPGYPPGGYAPQGYGYGYGAGGYSAPCGCETPGW